MIGMLNLRPRITTHCSAGDNELCYKINGPDERLVLLCKCGVPLAGLMSTAAAMAVFFSYSTCRGRSWVTYWRSCPCMSRVNMQTNIA